MSPLPTLQENRDGLEAMLQRGVQEWQAAAELLAALQAEFVALDSVTDKLPRAVQRQAEASARLTRAELVHAEATARMAIMVDHLFSRLQVLYKELRWTD